MSPSLWVYAAAFVGSALLSWLLVRFSIRLAHWGGLLDAPDGKRKLQNNPIPKVGGIAVALAFTIVFLIAVGASGDLAAFQLLASVLLPALGVAVLGFVDDIKPLNPWLRLVIQSLLALSVWWMGTRIEVSGVTAIDLALTVLWIVGLTNAMNLLDNADGLAAGTSVISSLGAAAIAGIYGQYFIAGLALALAGVAAGFLWHNWAPASVYLGDAGSYFLGFLLAIVTLRLRPVGIDLPWSALIPLLLAAVPIVDTCFVVVRRIREGRHPFMPGRDHLSHALTDRGMGTRASVGALQSAALLCSVGAIGVSLVFATA